LESHLFFSGALGAKGGQNPVTLQSKAKCLRLFRFNKFKYKEKAT
jgi:hypothetical protein